MGAHVLLLLLMASTVMAHPPCQAIYHYWDCYAAGTDCHPCWFTETGDCEDVYPQPTEGASCNDGSLFCHVDTECNAAGECTGGTYTNDSCPETDTDPCTRRQCNTETGAVRHCAVYGPVQRRQQLHRG